MMIVHMAKSTARTRTKLFGEVLHNYMQGTYIWKNKLWLGQWKSCSEDFEPGRHKVYTGVVPSNSSQLFITENASDRHLTFTVVGIVTSHQ